MNYVGVGIRFIVAVTLSTFLIIGAFVMWFEAIDRIAAVISLGSEGVFTVELIVAYVLLICAVYWGLGALMRMPESN